MKKQDEFNLLPIRDKVDALVCEIQNLYILLKNESRNTPVSKSREEQEDMTIRKMEIFPILQ